MGFFLSNFTAHNMPPWLPLSYCNVIHPLIIIHHVRASCVHVMSLRQETWIHLVCSPMSFFISSNFLFIPSVEYFLLFMQLRIDTFGLIMIMILMPASHCAALVLSFRLGLRSV